MGPELFGDVVDAISAQLDQGRRRRLVEQRPLRPDELVVDGGAYECVRELHVHRRILELAQQPRADDLDGRAGDVAARPVEHARELVVGDLPAEDGRPARSSRAASLIRADSGDDDVVDRRGDGFDADRRLDVGIEVEQHFGGEQGISPSPLVDETGKILVGGVPGRGGHRQDVVDVEPVEGHPLDVAEPPEVRDELGEVDVPLALRRAVRDGDSDGTIIDRRQHVLDELASPAIGPVQVVDHEQHRPPARGVAQPPGDRFRQSVAERVRIRGEWLRKSGHGFGELGEDEPQIARTGTELGGRAGHEAKERSECLGERLVRPAHPVVATPVQDDGTVARRPPSHFACEPRLPDAWLTADQHAASATCGRVRHGPHHGRQLVMAAGEREQLAAVQRLSEDPA